MDATPTLAEPASSQVEQTVPPVELTQLFAMLKKTVRNEVKPLRNEVKALRNEVKALCNEVKAIHNEVKTLRYEVKAIHYDLVTSSCFSTRQTTPPSVRSVFARVQDELLLHSV